MDDKKIGAIIVTFNNVYNTLDTVGSLLDSDYKNIETVVVDNSSKDTLRTFLCDELRRKFSHTEFLPLEAGGGYGHACNGGVQHLKEKNCDIFLFLNNDVILDKKCVSNLVRNFDEKDVASVGPKVYLGLSDIIYSAGGFFHKKLLFVKNRGNGEIDKGQYNRREQVEFINGCVFAISAGVFTEMEGFDRKFHYYSDEADLCYRIVGRGYKIIYEPEAVAYHWSSTTLGSESKKTLYYMVRSQLYFVTKHTNNKITLFYNMAYIFYHFVVKLTFHKLGQTVTRYIAVGRGIMDFILGIKGKGPYG